MYTYRRTSADTCTRNEIVTVNTCPNPLPIPTPELAFLKSGKSTMYYSFLLFLNVISVSLFHRVFFHVELILTSPPPPQFPCRHRTWGVVYDMNKIYYSFLIHCCFHFQIGKIKLPVFQISVCFIYIKTKF